VVSEMWGIEIGPFPLLRLLAYTTPCTTMQACDVTLCVITW